MIRKRSSMVLWYLFCLILGHVSARAQDTYVRVHLTDGTRKWYEPLPVTHRTADRGYWATTAVSQALTIADVENSLYALRQPGTGEVNPLLGSNPTRLRYYAVLEPFTVLMGYLSWRYKREDDALKASGIQGHKYVKWWMPNAAISGAHIFGLLVTIEATGR